MRGTLKRTRSDERADETSECDSRREIDRSAATNQRIRNAYYRADAMRSLSHVGMQAAADAKSKNSIPAACCRAVAAFSAAVTAALFGGSTSHVSGSDSEAEWSDAASNSDDSGDSAEYDVEIIDSEGANTAALHSC
jgi:hypothetical protein